MSLGKRIKEARDDKKWSQADLAQEVGISQNAIQKLEKGGGKGSARTRYLLELSQALGVYAYWLQTGKGPKNLGDSMISLPILEWHEVSGWSDGTLTNPKRRIIMPVVIKDLGANAYWLEVKDDMHAIARGEMALIDPEREAQVGNIVLAETQGRMYLLELQEYGKKRLLKPVNPHYEPIEITPEVKIWGVVCWSGRSHI